MRSQVVIEIPSSESWLEMKGYLKQWKLDLPRKFVVKKTNLREIRETLGRAQRIVMTHERSDEFGPMLESIVTDLKAQTSKSSRRN
jgi:ribosomal protein L17